MNNFEKLQFKKGKLEFKDGRRLMTGTLKGNYTRDGIKDQLESLSNELKKSGKSGSIGASYHFEANKAWVPSIMSQFGEPVSVWDFSDSDRGQAYIGDTIDDVQFYIINKHQDKQYFTPSTGKQDFKKWFGK